jgi:anthranilate synthase component II
MKILVLDNYDSFTYNLVQYITELTGEMPAVFRNDKIDLQSVAQFDTIVLSPGPGLPADAGIMPQLIQKYAPTKRILGVCLGHQAIGEAFGGKLYNLKNVYHGIASPIHITNRKNILFENIPNELVVGRYHSWAVAKEGFPKDLHVTAEDEKGVIMAMSHHTYDVHGVQFHPESIMTDYGKQILKNFLRPLAHQNGVGHAIEYMF